MLDKEKLIQLIKQKGKCNPPCFDCPLVNFCTTNQEDLHGSHGDIAIVNEAYRLYKIAKEPKGWFSQELTKGVKKNG